MNAAKALKIMLLAGVFYFIAMSIAHFFSFKVPILFIYWNTPFFAYQDKIISFAVLTYVALFYTAYKHRIAVPAALFSITATVLGLSLVNLSGALDQTLTAGQTFSPNWSLVWVPKSEAAIEGLTTIAYWAQTILIALYGLTLYILYFLSGKSAATAASQ